MEEKKKDDYKKKIMKEYDCGYCKYIFKTQVIRVESGLNTHGDKGRNSYSSQVQCPRCKNFLKTWKEGKEL